MPWPAWIDWIKERYLDDEASVFLVVGDIHTARWSAEGETLDAANVLVRFLAQTRPVVGVLRAGPGGALRFPTFAEEKKFDELVDAAMVMQGRALALSARDPMQALGRMWLAMSTRGTDQAYMVVDVDQLAPAKRKRQDPVQGAPELNLWATHPSLRQSNHIVIFLAKSVDDVRPDVVRGCAVVSVDLTEAPMSASELEALQHLQADVAPQASGASAARPVDAVPVANAADEALEALSGELAHALVHALVQHPEEHRAAKLPVMEAVATVLELHGSSWSGLVFTLDAEGAPVCEGKGASDFMAAWRADIALDASAGMLLKALRGGFSEQSPPDLDATALRALTKRVAKKIA
jgi:hypothetical protein